MADKKTQMEKIREVREAYVKAQADKGEDRVTQADMEAAKKFLEGRRPPKKSKPVFLPDVLDEGDDLPMSKESSPTVTDTETGETTYGKPQNFSCGGMGKAVRGGKFIGVK